MFFPNADDFAVPVARLMSNEVSPVQEHAAKLLGEIIYGRLVGSRDVRSIPLMTTKASIDNRVKRMIASVVQEQKKGVLTVKERTALVASLVTPLYMCFRGRTADKDAFKAMYGAVREVGDLEALAAAGTRKILDACRGAIDTIMLRGDAIEQVCEDVCNTVVFFGTMTKRLLEDLGNLAEMDRLGKAGSAPAAGLAELKPAMRFFHDVKTGRESGSGILNTLMSAIGMSAEVRSEKEARMAKGLAWITMEQNTEKHASRKIFALSKPAQKMVLSTLDREKSSPLNGILETQGLSPDDKFWSAVFGSLPASELASRERALFGVVLFVSIDSNFDELDERFRTLLESLKAKSASR